MKKILWGVVILAMLVSIPFLWERVQVEGANDVYELSIPYDDIELMSRNAGLDAELIYERLTAEQGIQSVALEPLTISDLRSRDLVEYVSTGQLLQLYDIERSDIPQETGFYLQIIEENELTEPIEEVLNYERSEFGLEIMEMEIEGDTFFYVPFGSSRTLNEPITFDMEAYEEVVSNGLSVIPRLENNFYFEEENHVLFRQLEEMSENASHVLFTGLEIVGFGEPEAIANLADRMNRLGLGAIMIENSDQRGLHQLMDRLDRDHVRLHSMTLGSTFDPTDYTAVFRGARAVHERNNQIIFVNLLNRAPAEIYTSPDAALKQLDNTEIFLSDMHRRTSGEPGIAMPYENFQAPIWFTLIVLLAAASFVGIVASLLSTKLILPLAGVSFIGFAGIALVNIDILMKLIVLGLAILAPTYAVLSIKQPESTKQVAIRFLQAIGITLTGAWFVVTLLYGSDYISHLDTFRGVKVLSIAPVIILAAFFIGYRWLSETVKFWHLVFLAVVGGLALFYVTRTGNAGVALPYELEFRQLLENTFSVRPRTTEFLIGIPIFVTGLYMWKEKVLFARFLLLAGGLGFASMVGTFTHLHTPFVTSVIRTALSIGIGAVIGVALIVVVKAILKWVVPAVMERVSR
ncbi:hypothetical protein FLK61_37790 [Paenalkalicoccus suaedae]|uniref:Uncharacterized protein n=1 Tax=Paenalkalicoccus suaedae TaxID=2592382 RepID=A0A859FI91_9BACI|nr:DUF5693 family protein [Paenalkalicoccus suaedae]QKS72382.1 hypothetical protein FLK61_37790 [Paenalkalicoccus suaedae]